LAKQKPERKRYSVTKILTRGLKKQNVATKSVTSTDGTLTIPQTNNCARKPGQRKREECKNIFLQNVKVK
jgi:hypothetical protein